MHDPVHAPLDAGYAAPQSILKRAMSTAAQPWSLISALLDAYTVIDHIQLTSQTQQAEIRKSCAINLAKARTEGGCSSQLSIGTQETPMALDEMPSQPPTHEIISPFRSVTPPPRAPTEDPPITARAVRFTTSQP
ncbi:hypothetical protein TSTA_040570 [Talaromyces stipitatus ATCC 10500]|uniref:Uncharacterized protein n=1 Tax=Talaromyces stipitatus (strain ATCC 10500 / CBS 375.48 / QM 6759 / NRRL 1006) TaxID=441959 RepID=B8MI93_TALSN|nr:uncharacterized protein TSTA_040570 [Talaromyces stipitatus ATCC 10500]EED14577.1 hypothetical protein TSTA_040570 [Talaromyces stipitatus ATCC 10500]